MWVSVVVSDEGGLPETLVDGVTGWAVPRDPRPASKRFVSLLDENTRRAMGEAAATHGRGYDWRYAIHDLENEIARAANGRECLMSGTQATRLMVISPSLEDGGVESYLRTLVAGARERAYGVTVAIPFAPELVSLRRDLEQAGAATIPLAYRWRQPSNSREAARQTLSELLAAGVGMIRAGGTPVLIMLPHPDMAPGIVLAAALLRRRAVVVVHLVPPDVAFTRTRRIIYTGARMTGQRWICVSQNNAEVLTDAMAWPPGAVTTVYNGVPASARPSDHERAEAASALRISLGLPDRARVILAVGRLNVQKGHDLILEGMADVLRSVPDAHWVWAGDGPEREALLERARGLGLDQKITLLGHVEAVTELMVGSDVLVFPSRYEGLGLAVLEAQMAGLPVIVSDAGPLPEIVRAGIDGLVVPSGDATALAVATVEVLTQPEGSRERASAAGDRVRARVRGRVDD